MTFRVEVTARAERDLRHIFRHIAADGSVAAGEWFNGLEALVLNLAEHPLRGASVPEDPRLRQVLYGRRPHVYRIIYAVQEGSGLVHVLHIRHGAREALGPGDALPEDHA